MLVQPLDVAVRRGGVNAGLGLAQGHQGGRLSPGLSFDVAVGERKAAGAGVVGCGEIQSSSRGWSRAFPVGVARVAHVHTEGAVVDRVAAFVERDVDLRRAADLLAGS